MTDQPKPLTDEQIENLRRVNETAIGSTQTLALIATIDSLNARIAELEGERGLLDIELVDAAKVVRVARASLEAEPAVAYDILRRAIAEYDTGSGKIESRIAALQRVVDAARAYRTASDHTNFDPDRWLTMTSARIHLFRQIDALSTPSGRAANPAPTDPREGTDSGRRGKVYDKTEDWDMREAPNG